MLKIVQDAEAAVENTSERSLLDEIVRDGARQMLAAALQAEVAAYIEAFADQLDENGHRLVVRNGYHAEREVTTAAGAVPVRAPRVNDKRAAPVTGERSRFSSAILPAWARKSPRVAEVLPLLYLHGLSTSDFGPALAQFLGTSHGLSAATITRLTRDWQDEAETTVDQPSASYGAIRREPARCPGRPSRCRRIRSASGMPSRPSPFAARTGTGDLSNRKAEPAQSVLHVAHVRPAVSPPQRNTREGRAGRVRRFRILRRGAAEQFDVLACRVLQEQRDSAALLGHCRCRERAVGDELALGIGRRERPQVRREHLGVVVAIPEPLYRSKRNSIIGNVHVPTCGSPAPSARRSRSSPSCTAVRLSAAGLPGRESFGRRAGRRCADGW